MVPPPPLLDPTELDTLLEKYGVAGVTVAVLQPGKVPIATQVAGLACREKEIPVFDSTWFEIASISKTFAAAFMIQYFAARGIGTDAKVNELFRDCGASFQLQVAEGMPEEWADEVTLAQLVNHTGLGMHYVNGVPLSHDFPAIVKLISGSADEPAPYGYASLHMTKQPGTKFAYSGGGFLVLQHLLEEMEGRPIGEIMAPFLAASGAGVALGVSFEQRSPFKHYAVGYRDGDGGPVEDTRLMFPPLAAGALGTSAAVAEWLRQLAVAYKCPEGCGGIDHATAVLMLTPGPDLGSFDFMWSGVGLGVFVLEAQEPGQPPNKWMLHQAANDGFRGFYLVCFDGPDAADGPRGFVILSNGDNDAMFLNCAVARQLLKSAAPEFSAVDWSQVVSMDGGFTTDGLKQAEIVNLGFKDLVLRAFTRTGSDEDKDTTEEKAGEKADDQQAPQEPKEA